MGGIIPRSIVFSLLQKKGKYPGDQRVIIIVFEYNQNLSMDGYNEFEYEEIVDIPDAIWEKIEKSIKRKYTPPL